MTMKERFTFPVTGQAGIASATGLSRIWRSAGIWKLLRPEDIGVRLTEGMMMEPEASVTALVFHHPDCVYFSVTERV